MKITAASSPSKASLTVAGKPYSLPQRGLAIPDRTQTVTIAFEDGTEFDCSIEPVEGRAYFFKKEGSVCP